MKALVVACNTATAAAIHLLRERHPDLPIVGVEPALKPAAVLTCTGRVAVFATRGTLASSRFAALRDSLARVRNNGWALAALAEVYKRKGDAAAEQSARQALSKAWFGAEGGPDLTRL